MLPFLALLVLAVAPLQKSGRVAVVTEPFVFEETLARDLCPDRDVRLTVCIGTPSAVDPFAQLGAPPACFALDMNSARPGDLPALAVRVAAARCIVLEGGTWLDWWYALRPYGKQSELGRALVAAHKNGANVIGIGPAGAHLGGLCVLSRATLQRPSRDPHATAQDIVLGGLGLAPGACIDFATDGRTDPERLLVAAFDAHVDLGVWLAGPCAWIQDESAHTATVAGPGAAFVFDVQPARRSRNVIEGVRVVRLFAGGTYDLAQRVARSPARTAGERSVQNDATSSVGQFFGATQHENDWISRKVLDLRGEAHRLRLTFDDTSDGSRGDPGRTGADTARLDWLDGRP